MLYILACHAAEKETLPAVTVGGAHCSHSYQDVSIPLVPRRGADQPSLKALGLNTGPQAYRTLSRQNGGLIPNQCTGLKVHRHRFSDLYCPNT